MIRAKLSRNQSTGTQSSVTSASRFRCGTCIICRWKSQLTMFWFIFSFPPFFVLSVASQPHPTMRWITPIMHSYCLAWKRASWPRFPYVSRRIPHLTRNILETLHLRHTRMISPNLVGAHWSATTLAAEKYSHIYISFRHCEAMVIPMESV